MHGIDALVEEGRRVWHERGAIGDLEAVRGRSRVGESEALLDPQGLGSFRCSSGWSSDGRARSRRRSSSTVGPDAAPRLPPMSMGTRVPLTRERIIAAAVELVDESGLDALSMRKLGAALGVEAMSLYNHVDNKDDVLDGILDAVLREVPQPDPGLPWDERLRELAHGFRRVGLAHPGVLPMFNSRRIVSAEGFAAIANIHAILLEVGFDRRVGARRLRVRGLVHRRLPADRHGSHRDDRGRAGHRLRLVGHGPSTPARSSSASAWWPGTGTPSSTGAST